MRTAPSTRSAAPGARWRGCTCGRPDIRCMSCTATPLRPTTRSSSPVWCTVSMSRRLSNIEVVNNARRPLLAYAALVLEYVLRIGKPRQVVFSALGVREGLLYSLLKQKDKEKDALIEAARDSQPIALALAASWRRTDRLDRSLHGVLGSRRDRRGTPSSPRRMPVGGHRLAGASRLPRRAIAQHHRPWRLHRNRSSGPRLSGAGGVLPPRRIGDGRRACRRGCANSLRRA